MPRMNLDESYFDALVERMERRSVAVEADLRKVFEQHGLTLTDEAREAVHGAVMEAAGAALEAEDALRFLD